MKCAKRARVFVIDCNGGAAVEFAMLAPALLFFLLITVEAGRMIWTKNALQYAVTQAARCNAIGNPACASAPQTKTYAAGKVQGVSVAAVVFTVGNQSCGVQVSATLSYKPLIGPSGMTLTAQSCYPT